MGMKKSVGNMYPWVTHTHSHLGGECPHKCVYCYVSSFPFKPAKYQGPLRLIEKEFTVRYGRGNTIFIENCNDLFAAEVPSEYIKRVISHCFEYPDNTYVFQTKNPGRYITIRTRFPPSSILGCTIETNRSLISDISRAPHPMERVEIMSRITRPKFVTIEPIMDFDVRAFSDAIISINPTFINIGADSKGHKLPEPPVWKIDALIRELRDAGIEIREKHNLNRIAKAGAF